VSSFKKRVSEKDYPKKIAISGEYLEKNHHVSLQFKGSHRKKEWTMDLCLNLFAEQVLTMLDRIESKSTMGAS
jgi:translation initiation factor IF-3